MLLLLLLFGSGFAALCSAVMTHACMLDAYFDLAINRPSRVG
jgi:hypothetical protein